MIPSFRLKMRVECASDTSTFVKVMKKNSIPIRINEVAPFPQEEVDWMYTDRMVTFTVLCPFDETIIGTIINAMRETKADLHVAYQTLTKEENYTGERDFDIE